MVPHVEHGRTLKERIDVLGSKISALDSFSAAEKLDKRLATGLGGYVCFTNVHAVITGFQDQEFRQITNSSFMSLADGKPVYWAARKRGAVGHVAGPDFMLQVLRQFGNRRHFFYGSTPEVLGSLERTLSKAIPELNISGMLSPPFRALAAEEKQEHYATIRRSGAELVWVGLGAPKQEQWMAEAHVHLKPAVLLGVGAAFDFHAGEVRRAPPYMRTAGLEWLYRLAQQPRRLWKRYMVTNTLFLIYLSIDRGRRISNRERRRTK